MRSEVVATVGLGSNLGDASATIKWALQELCLLATGPIQASSLVGSSPVDASGPDFVNAVARFSTRLTAPDLLAALQAIELLAGRQRPYRNAPRTLDLDLLLYGHASIASTQLTVPHPRMWDRAFVVQPLAQIAPDGVSANALARVAGQGVWVL